MLALGRDSQHAHHGIAGNLQMPVEHHHIVADRRDLVGSLSKEVPHMPVGFLAGHNRPVL